VPSIRFDLRLSREGEADKSSGRVGSDPSGDPEGDCRTGASGKLRQGRQAANQT
jgi:hydroxyquinol 1,2-dioxygenase